MSLSPREVAAASQLIIDVTCMRPAPKHVPEVMRAYAEAGVSESCRRNPKAGWSGEVERRGVPLGAWESGNISALVPASLPLASLAMEKSRMEEMIHE